MGKMTKNGLSTTAPGKEQYEFFMNGRKRYCQYDYRNVRGELFSCIKPTLEACRAARDEWIARR
jgi:hypothetical protein